MASAYATTRYYKSKWSLNSYFITGHLTFLLLSCVRENVKQHLCNSRGHIIWYNPFRDQSVTSWWSWVFVCSSDLLPDSVFNVLKKIDKKIYWRILALAHRKQVQGGFLSGRARSYHALGPGMDPQHHQNKGQNLNIHPRGLTVTGIEWNFTQMLKQLNHNGTKGSWRTIHIIMISFV